MASNCYRNGDQSGNCHTKLILFSMASPSYVNLTAFRNIKSPWSPLFAAVSTKKHKIEEIAAVAIFYFFLRKSCTKLVTMGTVGDNIKLELSGGFGSTEVTKASVVRVMEQIKRYQERIRKHIEDNNMEFLPNYTTSDMYIDEGETLLRESEHLLKNVGSDARLALSEANAELNQSVDVMREASLGLRVSYRILKIDDLFQCVKEANATKDYLIVLDLLGKLKSLIYNESTISDVDRLFQKCDCYDTIKARYQIETSILQENLQMRFEDLVQFSEKSFPSTKNVTLQVSKDVGQLQDTVMALFQARYNPMKICDFLLDNCLVPMTTKPVSVEYFTDNPKFVQLNISYSLKELSKSLRPSYKQVFAHIKSLLNCLANINVNVSSDQHVFTIIGSHIKERLLKLIVDECLMNSVPETMDEYHASTLVEDVLGFEQILADSFFIDPEKDRELTKFTLKLDTLFRNNFSKKVFESAGDIMQKDLQDMVTIAEGNTAEEVAKNPFLFPQCMISKSTLELVKLMERILRQPLNTSASVEGDEANTFLSVIAIILKTYIANVPKIHEQLLKSIPQQSVLFYNNCMFLAHWLAKNVETDIPTHPALAKALQATGTKTFKTQVMQQQRILMDILKEFDLSDTHSIGSSPLKLLRQCLRQLDLLKNVWLNVLPDSMYTTTFCSILDEFCQDIIKRILSLEDISATVASELSELIDVILEKAPKLFKNKHDILQVSCWMKLQQLKMILNASLQEITEQWCDGAGILTANYNAEEVRHLIRALFQNTDRRAKALSRIV